MEVNALMFVDDRRCCVEADQATASEYIHNGIRLSKDGAYSRLWEL